MYGEKILYTEKVYDKNSLESYLPSEFSRKVVVNGLLLQLFDTLYLVKEENEPCTSMDSEIENRNNLAPDEEHEDNLEEIDVDDHAR